MGIVPVHLYGLCADMKAISADRQEAQPLGGRGQRPGHRRPRPGLEAGRAVATPCATSFIIQKNLGTFGDGGAVVTNREDIDATVRRLRNHGSLKRSVHSFGFNSRLDDLHAAILSVKLKHITKWTDRRREIAARYTKGLAGHQLHAARSSRAGYRHVYHLYVIEHAEARRAGEVPARRRASTPSCTTRSPSTSRRAIPGASSPTLEPHVPNCEQNAAQCLSLPMFPELTDDEVDYTIEHCLAVGQQAETSG